MEGASDVTAQQRDTLVGGCASNIRPTATAKGHAEDAIADEIEIHEHSLKAVKVQAKL